MKEKIIGVVIATSNKRSELLFSRSLKSVMNQTEKADVIIIVDDNTDESEFYDIKKSVERLNDKRVVLLRNNRTKGMSGTGAWNTGASYLVNRYKKSEDVYIAILDDDDEWDQFYLEYVKDSIVKKRESNIDAIFANIRRITDSKSIEYSLNHENLNMTDFLIGNPGVQGSNMIFNLKSFNGIDGFDEALPSTTDRDIMIRFLERYGNADINIIDKVLVNHYASKTNTVTSDQDIKHRGLDLFYKKHIQRYSENELVLSLERAKKYFNYLPLKIR